MRTFVHWAQSLVHAMRGAAAVRRGDDEGVIAHYSRAIELSPEDLDYYRLRAEAYWHMDELGLAAADYTQILDLYPLDLQALVLRGLAYARRGHRVQALRDLNQYLETVPDSVVALYWRAVCHFENDDVDLALADLTRALELEPSHDNARKLLDRVRGRIHLEAHRKDAEGKA